MNFKALLISIFMIAIVFSSGCVSDTTTGGATGGEVQCQESWECTDWTECVDGASSRVCADSNSCGTTANKPAGTKTCEMPAEPVPEKPSIEVEAFMVSHGTTDIKFLKAYIPVFELLGDSVGMRIRFMDRVMHGADEMRDNTRLYSVQEEYGDKLSKYLRCFARYGNQNNYPGNLCLVEAEIDKESFDLYVASVDEEFSITKDYEDSKDLFPPYNLHKDLIELYGVTKTPTLYVNGVLVSFKYNPESIKDAICDTLTTHPAECSEELSSSTATVGFGPVSY